MDKPVASVEVFAARDLAQYVVDRARRRGIVGVVSTGMVRACGRLLTACDSRFQLVAALDHVIETFADVVGVNERLLTVGVIDVAVKELGGYNRPWEALYFRRFVATVEEDDYFELWLGALEDVETASFGSTPRLGEELYQDWSTIKQLAEARLAEGVAVIRQRFSERGKLLEWRRPPRVVEDRVFPQGAGLKYVGRGHVNARRD